MSWQYLDSPLSSAANSEDFFFLFTLPSPPCSSDFYFLFLFYFFPVVRASNLPVTCLDIFTPFPHLDCFRPDHLPHFAVFGQTYQAFHNEATEKTVFQHGITKGKGLLGFEEDLAQQGLSND